MQSRFVALLNLLAVPVLAFALYALWRNLPRARWLIVLVALVAALANVVSSSPKHLRYVETAQWLTSQAVDLSGVYFDEPAIAYLAGVGRADNDSDHFWGSRAQLERAIAEDHFELYVLSGEAEDQDLLSWAEVQQLRLLAVFSDERPDRVFVFGKPQSGD